MQNSLIMNNYSYKRFQTNRQQQHDNKYLF